MNNDIKKYKSGYSSSSIFIELMLFIIMILILMAILFDENMAAKFTTGSTTPPDTARAAAWSVNVSDTEGLTDWSQGKTITLTSTTAATFKFKTIVPKEKTETRLKYQVRVVCPATADLSGVDFNITDSNHMENPAAGKFEPITPSYDKETKTYTFYPNNSEDKTWEIPPLNELNDDKTLNITLNDTTKALSDVNCEIYVDFIQIVE